MKTTSSEIARMLRHQAWERAKGELRSILPTFYSADTSNCSPGQYAKLDAAITKFIVEIEDAALQE